MAYDFGLKRLPGLSAAHAAVNERSDRKLLAGSPAKSNPVPVWTAEEKENPFVMFKDPLTKERFGISPYHLARGVLLVGSAGTGKTNVTDILASAVLNNMKEGDITFLNDTKGEYYRKYRHLHPAKNTYVVGNGKEYKEVTRYWNIFGELMDRDENGRFVYVEDSDQDAMEISAQLYTMLKSDSQPAFPETAGQIHGVLLIYFMRKYRNTDQSMLNNKEFRQFVLGLNAKELKAVLEDPIVEDYRALKIYIFGGKSGNQSQGVLTFLFAVMLKVMTGPFAMADSKREFSVRGLFQKKEKSVLFLEMDFRRAKTMAPLYAVLMNQMMKSAIGGREEIRREVNVIIDEWSSLKAPLDYMESFLAQGRSLGAKLICGLQTVESINTVYKEEAGVIRGLFQTCICFRVTDPESLKFVEERTGKTYENISFTAGNENLNVQREGHSIEEWDIRRLGLGEAVVILPEEEPFLFHFPKYEDWREEERRCLNRRL